MPTFNFHLESCEPPDPIKDTDGMKPIGSWKGDSGKVYHTIDSHGGQLFHHYSVEVEIDTLGHLKREYIAQEMILDVWTPRQRPSSLTAWWCRLDPRFNSWKKATPNWTNYEPR